MLLFVPLLVQYRGVGGKFVGGDIVDGQVDAHVLEPKQNQKKEVDA